jgi:hypothetical protein
VGNVFAAPFSVARSERFARILKVRCPAQCALLASIVGSVIASVGVLSGCGSSESARSEAPDTSELARRRDAIVGPSELAPDENAIGNIGGGCSGTLIAPNLVLTTAHCVGKVDSAQTKILSAYAPNDLELSFHADVSGSNPLPLFDAKIAEVFLPDEAKKDLWNHDIGLLRLTDNVPAESATPKLVTFAAPVLGAHFSFIGYGATCDDCKPADALRDGRMGKRRSVSGLEISCADPTCAKAREGNPATDGNVFFGTYGPFFGDSGGPALDEAGAVFGVLSTVFEDDEGRVNGYTRMDSVKEYVVTVARAAADAGGYPVPVWAAEPAEPEPPQAGEPTATPSSSSSSSSSSSCTVHGNSGARERSSWMTASAVLVAAAIVVRRRRRR